MNDAWRRRKANHPLAAVAIGISRDFAIMRVAEL